ncbi:sensor histidine kinase [Nocardioides ferulae]|uniref:sensor histidine kinase n=1 Tax=Nocardioides ferulae TaxID=2340821 RepID=UPI000EB4F453|nr:sensor histidine kinase [Nocardioides ferulae]
MTTLHFADPSSPEDQTVADTPSLADGPAHATPTCRPGDARQADPPSGVRRVLLESAYALTAFPIALPAFVLVVVDLALGLGLSILIGGVLLLTLGVMVARGFARLERYRLRTWLGRPAPSPAYLCPPSSTPFWSRMLARLRDPQSWLDVVWAVAGLVTAIVAWAVALVWWAAVGAGLTYWFWQRWIPFEENNDSLAEILGLGDGRTAESLLNLAIGTFALLTLPWVVRAVTSLHAGMASALLSSRAELQHQVSRERGGRAAAHVAEADSLRRLERDIHDGPQQRLVRLTMDLGRAKRQLAEDPRQAQETLDAALAQARETVDELRSLSRGIAPPLLVDRGLAAALEEVALRSPVPVEPRLDVPAELPAHVETAAYFVVAETLTNVAKHSGADRARVVVGSAAGQLVVTVTDDGVGGAHPAKGSGLAGLQQRLAGVDGTLAVDSPTGGPTTVTARIPLRG